MSNEKKNTKSKKSTAKKEFDVKKIRRNIRLALGFFFLFLGSFLTLSVISYVFSWNADQDAIIGGQSLQEFLFNDQSVVQNLGGRLGAALSHFLVYRSLGIFALLFTLWVAGIGLNLVYAKNVFPIKKWIYWMALGFLFFCPLMAFLFPTQLFPWGGALGKSLIEWTNGFAGPAGNITMLLAVFSFFVFVVFQFDIKPWLKKASGLMPERSGKEGMVLAGGVGNGAEEQQDEFKGYRLPTEREEKALRNQEEVSSGIELKIKDGVPEKEKSEFIIVEHPADPDESFEEKTPAKLEIKPQEDIEIIDKTIAPDIDFEVHMKPEEEQLTGKDAETLLESKGPYDPILDLPKFKFPPIDLLNDYSNDAPSLNSEELQQNKDQIENTLNSFGISIEKVMATVGPTVTLYEIIPSEGVRISKIRNLEDDIALSLAALGIRIIAPIPGKGTIGIEVPNRNKQIVSMRSLLSTARFQNTDMDLPIALGKKIDNENYIVDLAKMPHLLMAGATGQGKSVGINAILVSLLYKKHPAELKFVMVDPKKVELSIYRVIEKHYLAMLPNEEEPIITDTRKVINTLNALTIEMDNRYDLLKDAGARNIKEYNDKFVKRKLNPNNGHKYLPFIVLVIDEFADLIMTAGKEIETPIGRLAQLARAVGIHLVIATQRPSVNVITGIIKANFPARIAFRVSAKVDSRTILDTGGADQLVGRGDMLISYGSELLRLQCAFVDTPEVERIVEFISSQRGYPHAHLLPEYESDDEESSVTDVDLSKRDKFFEDCARLVVNAQSGSTSMLQRKFNIGYNRAGRIMDQLEAAEIVGPQVGSKPREVYVSSEYELDNLLKELP